MELFEFLLLQFTKQIWIWNPNREFGIQIGILYLGPHRDFGQICNNILSVWIHNTSSDSQALPECHSIVVIAVLYFFLYITYTVLVFNVADMDPHSVCPLIWIVLEVVNFMIINVFCKEKKVFQCASIADLNLHGYTFNSPYGSGICIEIYAWIRIHDTCSNVLFSVLL